MRSIGCSAVVLVVCHRAPDRTARQTALRFPLLHSSSACFFGNPSGVGTGHTLHNSRGFRNFFAGDVKNGGLNAGLPPKHRRQNHGRNGDHRRRSGGDTGKGHKGRFRATVPIIKSPTAFPGI